ncbi:hypothetical protein ABPG74_005146 [Tetrahymena malaccensis]
MIGKKLFEMPFEGQLHKLTWMGFPKSSEFTPHLLNLQQNLALLAKTISKYEPVNLIVPNEETKEIAERLVEQTNVQSKFNISYILNPIFDLWLRDTGAIFVRSLEDKSKVFAVDFNFNAWGNKTKPSDDRFIAKFMIEHEKANLISTKLVLEGGAIEVDGEGTAILAESCILNDNRNPNWTKIEVEQELYKLLGIEKIIWVPGVKGMDITDGHIDLYARFVGPSSPAHVFVHLDPQDPSTQENLQIIQNSTDAKGRKLIPVILPAPDHTKIRKQLSEVKDSALSYCNYLVMNDAVVLAKFGDDETDNKVKEIMKQQFQNRTIEMIDIDYIINGGGGAHCSTQQQFTY